MRSDPGVWRLALVDVAFKKIGQIEKREPMSAYIVFIREKTLDKSELESYWQKAPAAMEN